MSLHTRLDTPALARWWRKAKINMESFIQVTTHQPDMWVDKSAGEGSVFLARLRNTRTEWYTEEGYVMGTSRTAYEAKTMFYLGHVSATLDGQPLELPTDDGTLERAEVEQERVLRAFVYAGHSLFEQMKCTYEFAQRINAYVVRYHTRMMPTIAYLFHPDSRSLVRDGYFEALVACALRSEWVDREQLTTLPDGHPQLSNLMAWVALTYTHHAVYASDESNVVARTASLSDTLRSALHIGGGSADTKPLEHISMEQMGLLEHTHGADDCESESSKASREVQSLIRYAQTPRCTDPLLRKLGRTGRLYVWWEVLGSVTTGDIGGTVSALSSATEMGAHIFTFGQPLHQAVDAIRRCAEPGAGVFEGSYVFDALVEESRRAQPIPLFLEGTGLSMPGPTDLPMHLRLWLPEERHCSVQAATWAYLRTEWTAVKQPNGRQTMPVRVQGNAGCRLFGSNGSRNPGGSNNGLWLASMMSHMHRDAFVGVHRMYTWRSGESHFYRTAEIGMTNTFIQHGFPLTKVAFVQHSGSEWTKGVDIGTLFSDRVALWREPAMESDERQALLDYMANEQPLVPQEPVIPASRPWEGRVSWDCTWKPPTQTEFVARDQWLNKLRATATDVLAAALPSLLANYASQGAKRWNMIGTLFACRNSHTCDCGARAAMKRSLQANVREWSLLFSFDPDQTTGAQLLTRLEKVMAEWQGEFYGHPLTALHKINNRQTMQPRRQQAMLEAFAGGPVGLHWDQPSDERVVVVYGPPHTHAEHATADCGGIAMFTPALIFY